MSGEVRFAFGSDVRDRERLKTSVFVVETESRGVRVRFHGEVHAASRKIDRRGAVDFGAVGVMEAVEFFETVLHADVDSAGTPVEDKRTRLLRALTCLHEKTANRRDAVVFEGGVGGKGESEVDTVVSGDDDVVAARHAHDAVEVPRLLEIRPVGLHREGLHVDRHVLVVPGKNGGRTVFHRENEVVVDNVASRENVTRFLEATGFTVERTDEGKGWLLKASRF